MAVERCDRSVLGVEVELGKLTLNPCMGKLHIDRLVVANPEGYESEYMVSAREVLLDLCMRSFFWSFFRQLVVQKVHIRDVDVVVEKSWKSWNVKDVLNFLESDCPKDARDTNASEYTETDARDTSASEYTETVTREAPWPFEGSGGKGQKAEASSGISVQLREVLVEDVGMRLQCQMLGDMGARFALADIRYSNFSEEVAEGYADDIVKLFFKSAMKTLIANIIGRRVAEWCL